MLVKLGDRDTGLVKPVQEWLCYNGISVVVDDDFGNATLVGVKKFQALNPTVTPVTGIVDDKLWYFMNYPIRFLDDHGTLPAGTSLLDAIVSNANRHYKVKPIEIGGENKGPFVRYYMKGLEGPSYAWCCGSMSTIVAQAHHMVGLDPKNFKYQMSCDLVYSDAKKWGTLVKDPVPGCIFLVYDLKNPSDCTHAGIVSSVDKANGVIHTFEGNTNDGGSRNGYEYIPRIRSITNKYYIKLG